jgi:acid phosphatase family membrane protein YuiD
MSGTLAVWPWVLACGLVNQLLKVAVHWLLERRLTWGLLLESVGLPSLHAAVMTCWVALLGANAGWEATETSVALVLGGIVLHDAVRLKGAAQAQRSVLTRLVQHLEDEQRFEGAAGAIWRVMAHRPFHVVSGALFGLLFALACPS